MIMDLGANYRVTLKPPNSHGPRNSAILSDRSSRLGALAGGYIRSVCAILHATSLALSSAQLSFCQFQPARPEAGPRGWIIFYHGLQIQAVT